LPEQLFYIENQSIVIVQSPTEQFIFDKNAILQSLIGESESKVKSIATENPELFLSKISFTHIVEYLKIEEPLQRSFYEIQSLKNNWTVKQLQREINSLLYERIGLSSNKDLMFDKLKNDNFNCF
jgi:hypothetical protein